MGVDNLRQLRDRLGEALYRMANFDQPKRWTPLFPDLAEFADLSLSENGREQWRLQADRLLSNIGPSCGLAIRIVE